MQRQPLVGLGAGVLQKDRPLMGLGLTVAAQPDPLHNQNLGLFR